MLAATAALARLERQIVTTSNTMDGYLRSAVSLPLAAEDANAGTLEDCCLALVRCGLADDSDNATERSDECCKQWRTWLKDVARGLVQLVGAGGAVVPANARSGARFGQAATGVNWAAFGGVRS
jgi:phage gp36-like protein